MDASRACCYAWPWFSTTFVHDRLINILCQDIVVVRLFPAIQICLVVRRQHDEFPDHSALRMSGYRAEERVRAGCIEPIGRGHDTPPPPVRRTRIFIFG